MEHSHLVEVTKEEAEIITTLLLNAKITGNIQELPKTIEKMAVLAQKFTAAFEGE